MQTTALLVIVALVIIAAIAVWLISQQRRKSQQLQERFGPEYEHAVHEHGGRDQAERELTARAERVEQLHIRSLTPEQSTRFAEAWRSVQSQFVDQPSAAIGAADRLVAEVMEERGYPMGEFEQRAADISVDHPHVVQNYRAAHAIAGRTERGEASTEDMRQAMVHYRSLFDELIETHEKVGAEVNR